MVIPVRSGWEPTMTPCCNGFGAELGMPAHMFKAGDNCSCWVTLRNPTSNIMENAMLYVVLDAFGTLFCAPSFSGSDCYVIDLAPGENRMDILPIFQWPDGVGSADYLFWYSGLMDSDTLTILSEIDMWEFGYN